MRFLFPVPTGVAALPGFAESIALLLERECYSYRDVGMMFGVCGERIRQLAAKLDIEPPGVGAPCGLKVERVWNDEIGRFVPQLKSVRREAKLQAARVARATMRTTIRDRRRAIILQRLSELRASLGREPTSSELFCAARGIEYRYSNGDLKHLVYYWFGDVRIKDALPKFRQESGYIGRERGGLGHRARVQHPPRVS